MANFGPLVAEIVSLVWGNQANFNGIHILAALLHGTQVVGVSQSLADAHYLSAVATIEMGRKLGRRAPLLGRGASPHPAQLGLDRGHLHAKCHLNPFSRLATI